MSPAQGVAEEGRAGGFAGPGPLGFKFSSPTECAQSSVSVPEFFHTGGFQAALALPLEHGAKTKPPSAGGLRGFVEKTELL